MNSIKKEIEEFVTEVKRRRTLSKGEEKELKEIIEKKIILKQDVAAKEDIKIKGPKDIYQINKYLDNKKQEHLVITFLESDGTVVSNQTFAIGGVDEVHLRPLDIFKEAYNLNANVLVLNHNHPSGDLTPSGADIEATEKIIEMASLTGITILDHLIITKNGYCSIKETKKIKFNDDNDNFCGTYNECYVKKEMER